MISVCFQGKPFSIIVIHVYFPLTNAKEVEVEWFSEDLQDFLELTPKKMSFSTDIKKRWQEYTEELYKKDLHDQDDHDGVITQLEPDILECEVKWALENITTDKASGGDRFQLSYFKS